MNPRTLLAAALTLTATAAFGSDGTFDRTLSLNGAATVSVSTGSGYIHVFPGVGSQVHVIGHVHVRPGWLGGDAEARVKQILANPPIVQSGNTVTVGSTHSDSDLFRNVFIDYDVATPATSAVTAHTGSGELQIGGIEGAVTAESGSGDIKAENIGPNARLETGSGSIHAGSVRGAAYLETGSGDLELSLTAAGDVKAQTGSGSIHIAGVSGALRAGSGSGSIEVEGNPTSDWRLESGSGAIRLKLAHNAHFTLNAGTGSGAVQLDRPIVMQGALNKHHVSGTVNGGGPVVRATTGSGDISLR